METLFFISLYLLSILLGVKNMLSRFIRLIVRYKHGKAVKFTERFIIPLLGISDILVVCFTISDRSELG
jgi:hypothetical protein